MASERIGKRRVIRALGEGGMGRVLLAEASGAGGFVRRVVLKQVRDPGDDVLRRALLEEARLQATLVHRNIVPLLDLEEHEGEHYLVLEYIDGLDLRRLMELHPRLQWRWVLHVGVEIAAALDYAHRRVDPSGKSIGLVHRDVTPANILCSWEGEVKLTDFGVAQVGRGKDGVVVGNFAYVSPEQACGEAVDTRADVYSLGVVLYQALTGLSPFRMKTDAVTLAAVRGNAFPPIADLLAPAPLRTLVTSMMSRDPRKRPQTAAAVREALLRVENRLVDPTPAFATFLGELRGRAHLDRSRFSKLFDAGRALTARLRGNTGLEHNDTVLDKQPLPLWLKLAAGLVGIGVVLLMMWGVHMRRSHPTLPIVPPVVTQQTKPHPLDETPTSLPTPTVTTPPEPHPVVAPKPPVKRVGTLSVNSVPWSDVWVDDQHLGHTPRQHQTLSVGRHKVKLRTSNGVERIRSVEIRPGKEQKLTVLFSEP
jgi:serine/threonine protein kinase